MNIEIDQSGKVENTSKNTVIAFSNDIFGTIFISAQEKREIQKFFRKIGKTKVFVYRLFAALIFLLINDHLKNLKRITIDEEYSGKENLIKSYLVQNIRRVYRGFSAENISFKRIGKKSKAHNLAYLVFKGKNSPNRVVKTSELLKILFK